MFVILDLTDDYCAAKGVEGALEHCSLSLASTHDAESMGGSISSLTRVVAFRFPFDGALEHGGWSPANAHDSESMGGLYPR